jgi:hypothetical protein
MKMRNVILARHLDGGRGFYVTDGAQHSGDVLLEDELFSHESRPVRVSGRVSINKFKFILALKSQLNGGFGGGPNFLEVTAKREEDADSLRIDLVPSLEPAKKLSGFATNERILGFVPSPQSGLAGVLAQTCPPTGPGMPQGQPGVPGIFLAHVLVKLGHEGGGEQALDHGRERGPLVGGEGLLGDGRFSVQE